MLILLALAAIAAVVVVVVVAVGDHGRTTAGVGLGVLLFMLLAAALPPYAICFVSVLYVASGGDQASGVRAGGGMSLPPASRRRRRPTGGGRA